MTQEEEYLIIESRKIEQNSKRLLKDREHVIKLINTIDSAFPMKKFFPQKRAAMEAASKLAMKPPAQVDSLEPLRVRIFFLFFFFLFFPSDFNQWRFAEEEEADKDLFGGWWPLDTSTLTAPRRH